MEAIMAEQTKLKACHECWANFTLAEWNELEPASEQDEGLPSLERRHCSKCGAVLVLDMDGVESIADEGHGTLPPPAPVKVSATAPIDQDHRDALRLIATWLRRASPMAHQAIRIWLNHVPTKADAVTVGELRKLVAPGQRR
jgi:hypothetical protein